MIALALRYDPEPKEGTLKPLPTHRPPDPDLPSYSPWRVKALLRLLPYMPDAKLSEEEEQLAQSLGYRSWPDDAMCDYLSIKEALHWLYQRDPRAELAIRLGYCVGMSTREVAAALHVGNATAWRWCQDGVQLLAWHLGYRTEETLHPFEGEE